MIHVHLASDDVYVLAWDLRSVLEEFVVSTAHLDCNSHNECGAWRYVASVISAFPKIHQTCKGSTGQTLMMMVTV